MRKETLSFKEKIRLGDLFAVTQMNHWALLPLGLTIFGLAGSERWSLLLYGVCGLVPFALSLLRRNISSFFPWKDAFLRNVFLPRRRAALRAPWEDFLPFMIVHGCVGVLFWFLPKGGGIPGILLTAYLMVCLARSVFLRLKTDDWMDRPVHPAAAVSLNAVLLFLQHYRGRKDWDGCYLAAMLLFFICYSFHDYLKHYRLFLEFNGSSTGYMPQREMLRSGLGLVFLYSLFGVSVLFLSAGGQWLSAVPTQLGNLLLWLLRRLFALLGNGEEEVGAEETGAEEPVDLRQEAMQLEPGESFWLWEVLENILLAATVAVLAALAFYGVWKLIRYLMSRFRFRGKQQGVRTETAQEVREKCGIARKQARPRDFLAFLRPGEQIRRIYKKKVWERRERLPKEPVLLAAYTAKECAARCDLPGLAALYEKARYSPEECTPEDVRRARKL
ncbi:MAG: hypothetical protein LBQ15_01485 [Clostridium sp.]|jgi:hypothetical protein|nr:hypothetical protein [Clostridium sp.]